MVEHILPYPQNDQAQAKCKQWLYKLWIQTDVGVTSDSVNLLTLSLGFLICKMRIKGLMSELNLNE